jgi:UDP-N-acetylglucosamine:LPS N-acetylglucosamine transferase
MKLVDLVYFNAGGGHRAAALALQSVITQQQRPWQARLVNLGEVLDPNGRFAKLTGMAPEDIYNKRLAKGWTLGLAQELKLLQAMIRLAHAPMVRQLQQHWLRTEPDLVVSLIPNFNRALYESVATSLPGVPFVTVMTDMADHPPNFWLEDPQDQHIVCGTERACEQARAMGYRESQLHPVSGMILHPDFHRQRPADRRSERSRLGLDPEAPTGIVLFGGQGSKTMLSIARQLPDIQLILMCGHNGSLARQLRAARATAPRLVVEFTREVPRYMQLGDFFIGKPGPGSISEAVQMGLPVITVRNAWTMPQERYNADWVRALGVGIVHTAFRSIRRPVLETIAQLPSMRERLRGLHNRAAFEVPGILAELLERSVSPGRSESSGSAWVPEVRSAAEMAG